MAKRPTRNKLPTKSPAKSSTRSAAEPSHQPADSERPAVVSPVPGGHREYPRPQLVRPDRWALLNGPWDFHIDPPARLAHPSDVTFDRQIVVPFAPETPASGVADTSFYAAVWYRRAFTPPALADDHRLLLHFGAVDYLARVYVDGVLTAEHEGGYSPFTADLTEAARERPGRPLEIVVHALDDPHDLAKPRGKQDWHLHPHSIWYPRTTGIWQSVWYEIVPETRITTLRWTPDPLKFTVGFEALLAGDVTGTSVRVRLSHKGRPLGETLVSVAAGRAAGAIHLHDPGIGDARNDLYWAPWAPNLLHAEIELLTPAGVADRVTSYTALRHLKTDAGRFWLNGAPLRLDLVLDQGYWPDTGLTAPDDAALRRDVELAKTMGFNGVRKHQKLEDPRWLFWADTLGLLVWSEFPGCYRFSPEAVVRTTRQWVEAVERDVNHPCIVAWVPFNESWGVPDLPDSRPQRALVESLYHLTKALDPDPERPVIGNDGWELGETDLLAIHDYDADPERLKARYAAPRDHFLKHERPGHKLLVLPGHDHSRQPVMLTEFGGIAYAPGHEGAWGYSRATDPANLARRYIRLLDAVRAVPVFSGFCYTQFTDTYQEANGLLHMDRTPKFDLTLMNVATRGPRDPAEHARLDQALGQPHDRAHLTK